MDWYLIAAYAGLVFSVLMIRGGRLSWLLDRLVAIVVAALWSVFLLGMGVLSLLAYNNEGSTALLLVGVFLIGAAIYTAHFTYRTHILPVRNAAEAESWELFAPAPPLGLGGVLLGVLFSLGAMALGVAMLSAARDLHGAAAAFWFVLLGGFVAFALWQRQTGRWLRPIEPPHQFNRAASGASLGRRS